ncbi:sulfotransferase family 2 domain-containing protein [Colwellia echini]|uniref:Sulfotransferase family protein n=1 Tax=Colwellia echini TaxID=1982103 RepID=A0ABY3MVV8_9GAMM|nr:sulfotransferase family 2 domain-containing protein [Colwellia echini]TYK65324.1 sulfotransferase family protein [Colwellia echini]
MLNEFIDPSTKVFHVHIPKTGGTSLNSAFKMCDWYINGEHSFYEVNFPFRGKRTADGKQWKNFAEKGFTNDMQLIAVIRNPFDWLKSYYLHEGSSFKGLIKHSGWHGCNDFHKFSSFSEFIDAYIERDFAWHVPPLHKSQIGQLNGVIDESILLVYNEFLDDFIDELSSIKNIKLRDRRRSNVSKKSEVLSYSTDQIKKLKSKMELFLELTGYDETGFSKTPSQTFISYESC